MTKRKPRKVVFCGSRSFPIDAELGGEVVSLMRTYPADTIFLVRGSHGFDQFVQRVADIIGYECEKFDSRGGGDNFRRDADMVREADEVVVFLDPASLSNDNTGTAHIIEKALDQKKPTRAYTAAHHRLVFAGET